ncbi:MAG: aspartyl beta-hydroxylase [Erysipelotrichaceae bacterium]|nr:aspartyl beta-hydroxylase [Erysipelotrichaceae bacterium]
MNFSEDLKKILLAGVGAVAISAEKSKEVVDTLVKKGELTVEQGKVINEELRRNVKEKLNDPVDVDSVSRDLEKLNKDDLEALKAKIEELQGNNESE